ncbi:MAG: ABC transporter permease subunit [Firmicutes bacterium]|nr:ABC transporter permease subunit [Bacillota bacterium]
MNFIIETFKARFQKKTAGNPVKRSALSRAIYFRNNYQYYLILLPPLLFYLIFKYLPMYGLLIAFQDYNFMLGVFHSPWVGLDVFKEVFRDQTFWNAFLNTIRLNLLLLLIGFPIPIIFTLFLNEISGKGFKRTIQTISYLPHFISWVIIYGIILAFVTPQTGLINLLLKSLGLQEINFLFHKGWWLFIYVFSFVWKEMGWSAIIYLAALSAIDPQLYEAAAIDGAGRFKCMWHITLPGIKNTIIIMLILNIGKMMTIGFDQPFNLQNVMVSDVATVLSTYIYDMGLIRARFSFTAAVGLFQSVINFGLLLGADRFAKMMGEEGIFGGGRQ